MQRVYVPKDPLKLRARLRVRLARYLVIRPRLRQEGLVSLAVLGLLPLLEVPRTVLKRVVPILMVLLVVLGLLLGVLRTVLILMVLLVVLGLLLGVLRRVLIPMMPLLVLGLLLLLGVLRTVQKQVVSIPMETAHRASLLLPWTRLQ